MRFWPWNRGPERPLTGFSPPPPLRRYPPESRAAAGGSSYSDILANLVFARAAGAPVDSASTAAVEAVAGLYARSLAVADVSPTSMVTSALSSDVLACIGRELIRRGECVFLLEASFGRLRAIPVSDWDVLGGPRSETWWYRISLPGPSSMETIHVPSSGVFHFRYAVDPREPWRGIGPLAWASSTARALAGIEGALSNEAAGATGYVIPLPSAVGNNPDDPDDPGAQLRRDVGSLRGGIKTVETTRGAYGEGAAGQPAHDWKQMRVGLDPPAPVVSLRSDTARAVFHACGVSESLFERADGTSAREAWRRFLHSGVAPVGLSIALEASAKLDETITLGFDRLFASDLASRARSLASMIQAGLPLDQAAALAGLSAED